MFLPENAQRIEREYLQAIGEVPDKIGTRIREQMESLEGRKQQGRQLVLAMKYLYAHMPLSDIGNYSFEVFLDSAGRAVELWAGREQVRQLPEELFLQYVLYHRVNEEEIRPCRMRFGALLDQAKIRTAQEVNLWCAANMTYQASDERTCSALAAFFSGSGRCGEESVFTVNALRAAGIPARQVYAPRWSHCDDNHAWVELYEDGAWHFIGACEPEPALDMGWFPNAASRAMMIYGRCFDPEAFSDPERGDDYGRVGREGMAVLLNQLPRYARTRTVILRVTAPGGKAASGAAVSVEILNYAAYMPIAVLMTDDEGRVSLETGYGTLHFTVSLGALMGEALCDCSRAGEFSCELREMAPGGEAESKGGVLGEGPEEGEEPWQEFEVFAPVDTARARTDITEQMKLDSERRMKECHAHLALKRQRFVPAWKTALFPKEPQKAERYMEVLSPKDRLDADPAVIIAHIREAEPFAQTPGRRRETRMMDLTAEEFWLRYVWNPRIAWEPLSAWREPVRSFFSAGQREAFRSDPRAILRWIERHLRAEQERERLSVYTQPAAALALGAASPMSLDILFVAIARTFGIPAKLDEQEAFPVYWSDGRWKPAREEDERRGDCLFSEEDLAGMRYQLDWSLARWDGRAWRLVRLSDEENRDRLLRFSAREGLYAVMTANRLPSGHILACRKVFFLRAGQTRQLALRRKQARLQDLLTAYAIPDWSVLTGRGDRMNLGCADGGRPGILLVLQPGKEPTEHMLNELMEDEARVRLHGERIRFILPGDEVIADPTLERCRRMYPQITVLSADFDSQLEMTARRLYVDPSLLPLMIVTDGKGKSLFAASGYSVGMEDMLMKVLDCAMASS